MARLTVAALLAGCAAQAPPSDPRAQAEPAEARLLGTEVHLFHSVRAGESYLINVALPDPMPRDAVPAVYVVGESGSFALVAETTRLLARANEIRSLLVVGVEREQMARANDHARLLSFIDNELKPFIATRYSVDASDSTLIGDRAGALFALYALFRSKQTFSGYLIVGPERTTEREASDLHARLFLATGGLDPDAHELEELTRRLGTDVSNDLVMETVIFHGETRYSAVPGAFSRGLRFLYRHGGVRHGGV